MSHKYVYLFTEGNGSMRELLGGKGANLAEMTNIGLPVPQGFTISTEACTKYYDDGQIVVARIGDEATVKRLRRRHGQIWLMPENENYEPIDGTEAEIIGIVKAVVREY